MKKVRRSDSAEFFETALRQSHKCRKRWEIAFKASAVQRDAHISAVHYLVMDEPHQHLEL